MRSFYVFNKSVEFSEEELDVLESAGIDTTSTLGNFLELMLIWNGIRSFDEDVSVEEVHDACIKALKNHEAMVKKTILGLGLDAENVGNTIAAEDERLEGVDYENRD